MLDFGHNNSPKQTVFHNYRINELKKQQKIDVIKVFLLACASMYKILVCEQKKIGILRPQGMVIFLGSGIQFFSPC